MSSEALKEHSSDDGNMAVLDEQFWSIFDSALGKLRDRAKSRLRVLTPPQIHERIKQLIANDKGENDESLLELAVGTLGFHLETIGASEVGEHKPSIEHVINRLRNLINRKGVDYNSGGVSILSYFIFGRNSILHEIHKRSLRMLSVISLKNQAPSESIAEIALDLIAYLLFLISYNHIGGRPRNL